jgi:hypothetical protein
MTLSKNEKIVLAFVIIIGIISVSLWIYSNVKMNENKKENFYYLKDGEYKPFRIFDARNNRRYFLKREHSESITQ